jgi:hypothetical protein
VGNLPDGRGTALFERPCILRRLSSALVREAKSLAFLALLIDKAEFRSKPGDFLAEGVLRYFRFRKVFVYMTDRDKAGMDGNHAAALTRHIVRAEY